MRDAQHPTRRTFLATAAATAAGAMVSARVPRVFAQSRFDCVIRGGLVVDGTGAAPFPADIGVVGDRVAAIGRIAAEQGRRVVDASGLSVAPGFIDIHTHSDGDIFIYPTADSRVRQGVTTEVTGNCGASAAPLDGTDRDRVVSAWRERGVDARWTSVASYAEQLSRAALSVNHALLVGQGTLRENAVGLVDRPLTRDELARVCQDLETALEQGAFGLSTGLEYVPGRFTPTDEIVALARVVARHGGIYASHIRNEEISLLEAVDEAIRIGRAAGCRVEISHLKASGRGNWGKQQSALDLIESARRAGVDVRADAYPYTAYSTSLSFFLPADVLEGGYPSLVRRLADPAIRARTSRELTRQIGQDPGDPSLIVIAEMRPAADQALVGRHVADIAAEWKVDAPEAVLRLLERNGADVWFVGHGMSEQNVDTVLRHPLVMVGSDGSAMAPVGANAQSKPHPRSYGTCARVLGRYCRERRLFDLPEAVRKMTSIPADQIGLGDRGRIAIGKRADLVVFDPDRVADTATFEAPHAYPVGIPAVLVNGVLVVEEGRHTGARPGRVLRRT